MTTQVYKLTTQENTTRNNTLWGENVSHETDGSGNLCSEGWLHAYTDKYLAAFLYPADVDFKNPKLWLAYGDGQRNDDNDLKVGFTKLTTKREIALPVVSDIQRIALAIFCALEVYKEPTFVLWANKWLSGEDRSKEAAYAAEYAARNTVRWSPWCAEDAARYAPANVAAHVAERAARYEANVILSAYYVANCKSINLKKLARKAMKVK